MKKCILKIDEDKKIDWSDFKGPVYGVISIKTLDGEKVKFMALPFGVHTSKRDIDVEVVYAESVNSINDGIRYILNNAGIFFNETERYIEIPFANESDSTEIIGMLTDFRYELSCVDKVDNNIIVKKVKEV